MGLVLQENIMLKFLGMMVTIIVFVMGFEAPHALAQQTSPQEWKTYINPEYKFTMQYPYSGDGKFASRDHRITILDNTSVDILDSSIPLLISITPKNGTEDINHMWNLPYGMIWHLIWEMLQYLNLFILFHIQILLVMNTLHMMEKTHYMLISF